MSGSVDVLVRVGDSEPRIVSLNLAGARQVSVTISFPLEDLTVSLAFTAVRRREVLALRKPTTDYQNGHLLLLQAGLQVVPQDQGRSTVTACRGRTSDLPAPPTEAEPAKQNQNDQDDDDEGRC